MKNRLLIVVGMVALMASCLFVAQQSLAQADENGSDKPGSSGSHGVVLERIHGINSVTAKSYPGTVKASNTAKLAFRVSGPLVRVNIKPGDAVKKGQVLMQIDSQDYKDKIQVLEAQKAGSVSQLETAKLDFARVKKLFSQNVVPQADYDHAQNAVNTLTASVDAVKAQLRIARHQLSYTSLRAPYDGIITLQLIENHEMVQAGRVVVGLHDISTLEIEIKVPENEIINHGLNSGEAALATFPCRADQKFDIQLKEWNTEADRITRTYAMVFTMPAPGDFMVLPGMTAEVVWSTPEKQPEIITIPARALVTDNSGESSVWVFDETSSTAVKKKVEVGGLNGSSRIVVTNGLSIGERIVTEGVDFITSTMKLNAISMKGRIQ
ncbi:MAG: efflux RND transporter periplasmic adaptor subunit [Desulfobacteraceae bacterium]|nr:efflux RND transporter periplasmic adaptor subunit [Desulfobacteraceae bacterium]